MYDVGDHLFQLVDELAWVVTSSLNLAQAFLPDTRQFGTFEKFFTDESDEFYTHGCGYEVLFGQHYLVSFVKCLDNLGTCGGATYTILFHGLAQFLVVDQFTCCLHGADERTLGIGFGGLCPLFHQLG